MYKWVGFFLRTEIFISIFFYFWKSTEQRRNVQQPDPNPHFGLVVWKFHQQNNEESSVICPLGIGAGGGQEAADLVLMSLGLKALQIYEAGMTSYYCTQLMRFTPCSGCHRLHLNPTASCWFCFVWCHCSLRESNWDPLGDLTQNN